MENSIGVGLIVGLAFASSIYVWNNEKFSSVQKTILLICIVFPPAQWLGILVVLAYNSNVENNTSERKTEKKLDSTISNLTELKEKGILTEEEYLTKVEKIDTEKTEQNIKNSVEYKQLKSLFDGGILTKDEFESKINILTNKDIFNTPSTNVINDKNTPPFSPSFEDYWSKNKSKFQKISASIGLMLVLLWIISVVIFVVQKYI